MNIIHKCLPIILVSFLLASCAKGPQDIIEVYQNDFDKLDLTSILGGKISKYNQSNVLGMYNNDGFDLTLENLPVHDLVVISFDLYIHDTWDGNDRNVGGPDIWNLEVDGKSVIKTTFSNCNSGLCIPQSYPLNFQNNINMPKKGASKTDLPGFCHFGGLPGFTTLYKIEKTISHKKKDVFIRIYDQLVQSNTSNPVCDESWSLDNIKVNLVRLR
jgi:hypothetical protein